MSKAFTPAALLFDLDGTLADTARDMIAAINRVLTQEGFAKKTIEELRDHVSHGSTAMIQMGFGDNQSPADFERRRQLFLNDYYANLCDQTCLFEGMEEVLERAETLQIPWGIITNKPAWLTDPLMIQMGLNQRAGCIISGDTLEQRKPHPAPLLLAAKQVRRNPKDCIYVGDAERDITAGNAAGMHTIVAAYGYIDASQTPDSWQADATIQTPSDLLEWLN